MNPSPVKETKKNRELAAPSRTTSSPSTQSVYPVSRLSRAETLNFYLITAIFALSIALLLAWDVQSRASAPVHRSADVSNDIRFVQPVTGEGSVAA